MNGRRKIILVPTYNEKDGILGLLGQLVALHPDKEVWVIDDNSPDGTGAVVSGFASSNRSVRLITRTRKDGLGEAYKHALKEIQGPSDIGAVLTMDADGSHDPAAVEALFAALEKKDLAIGSRYVKGGGISGWDKKRLMLSRCGNFYVKMLTGFPIEDATAGFVAFRKDVLDRVDLGKISSSGYSYQIEFKNALLRAGAEHIELPITFYERRAGASKVSLKIVVEGLLAPWHIMLERLRRLQLRSWIAAAIILTAVFFSFYKLSESPSVWYDEGLYYQMADHIAHGEPAGFIVSPGNIQVVTKVSVGYPLVYPIALLFKIFGTNILVARTFMALCILLLIGFAYALARRSFSPGVALFALALVALFPPLYGNGKSVLGEVPGIMYLVGSLFFLSKALSSERKYFLLVLSAVAAGLSVATKPIFILALPALAVGLFIARRRGDVSWKQIALGTAAALTPLLVWIVTQFNRGDSVSDVLKFYSNPQPGGPGLIATVILNVTHIFSDFSLLYLVVVLAIWVISFIIRHRQGRRVSAPEIAAFTFSLLIAAAYLRTAGYNRYLFPAQVVSLIYFPEALSSALAALRRKMKLSPVFQATLVPLGVLALFLVCGYSLMFHSWVANFYSSHKTAYWQEYFQSHQVPGVLFYNTPEVAIFDRSGDYSQYLDLAPAAGIDAGRANIDLLKKGSFSTVIMAENVFDDMKADMARLYRVVDSPYKYVILSRNK